MLIRCSAIHKIIGLPRSKNDRLTQTAKSHLIEQAKQELFGVSERAERQGRNPQTGETLTIPATKKPRFRPGKPLKEAVK